MLPMASAGHTFPGGKSTMPKHVSTPDPNSFTPSPTVPSGLLSVTEVLADVWPNPQSRPSIRWFRGMQAKRAFPYIKMGHLTFFEPDRVRAALRKFEVTCH